MFTAGIPFFVKSKSMCKCFKYQTIILIYYLLHLDFDTNIFYKGGHGGLGGCNVDSDSKLKIGTTQTNPKCRISLQQRPFMTVPFLGRGPSRPIVETQLMQGGYTGEKKSCKSLTEKTLRQNQDLVPSLKATIQNPVNLVESSAAEGWIRGGLPSRELSRDQDYFKRQ